MHKFVFALVCTVAVVTANAAAQVPSGSPAPFPTGVTARAKEWLNRLQTGSIDRSQLTSAVSDELNDQLVKATQDKLAPLGTPVAFTPADVHHVNGQTAYVYKVDFKNDTTIYFIFVLDDGSGKISGLRFSNAQ